MRSTPLWLTEVQARPIFPGTVRAALVAIVVLGSGLMPPGRAQAQPAEATARLRVAVKRGGQMIPASVQLYPPKAPAEALPSRVEPANQKFNLAPGLYDLRVEIPVPDSKDKAIVRVVGVKLTGTELKEVPVELADGQLDVAVFDNGRKAEGSLKVVRLGSTAVVSQGPTGAPVTLLPGPYKVEVVLSGASDYPARTSEVWIEPKKTTKLAEKFDTGQLTVGVFRDGQPVEALVQLALPGAPDFFNYFSAPGSVSLSPGAYDVLVKPKGGVPVEVLRRPRIAVAKGRENKIFFDLTAAKLAVKVVRAGRAVMDADVRVVEAGGGAEAAKPEPDGTFRVWPGRYEVVARLPSGDEARSAPFEAGFGEKLDKVVEFLRGSLVVRALRGKTVAEDAEVSVFKKGAQKPVAQGRAGAILELPPGVYDVKVAAGAQTVWREAVRVKENAQQKLDVELAAGGKGEALPDGDMAPPPEALPDGE
jgi:hypothetical protein